MKKIRRSEDQGWVAGVYAGIAYSLGIQAWILRVILFILICMYGVGLGVYVLLWIFVPKWEEDPNDIDDIVN